MSTVIPSVKPLAASRRVDSAPQGGEVFRRLLQDKDDGVLACAAAMPLLPRPAMAPDSRGAPRAPLAVSATQAALGATLNADTSPPPQSGRWEVSIHESLGVAVELDATREPTAWTLTIASPTTDASLLARHAPRLSERLRTRTASATHVRVERREKDKS
jgi:hypothetical protein